MEIEGAEVGRIDGGLLILLGVSDDDEEADAEYLVPKIANLRIFADEANRFNLSALDIGCRSAGGQPIHAVRRHPSGPPPRFH